MKQLLGGILCLCLTSFGWGETLALTVHNDNGDPGEAHSIWTETYYVDDQGRLVRTHRVIQGEFIGDPEINQDTVYHWETGRVWWETRTPAIPIHYQIDFEGDSLKLTWVNLKQKEYHGVQDIRALPGERVRWEDGKYRYSWSREHGFEMRLLDADSKGGAPASGYEISTDGSRISTWLDSRLYEFSLVDRTPQKLTGTFYSSFLEENGWVPTGTQTLFGVGIWNVEPSIRLVHATIFGVGFAAPFWPPFVFEEKYLK